jgi:hypothetical protein
MFYQDELIDLGNKILERGYSYNIYRVVYNLRAYNEPRILQVLIREIKGSSTL